MKTSSSSNPSFPLRRCPFKSPSPRFRSPPTCKLSETLMAESMERISDALREQSSGSQAMDLLYCVNDLQRAMQLLVIENSSSELLVRSHSLMQIAMKRLQNEIFIIVTRNQISVPDSAVSDLKAIANCMVGAGYGKECAEVYTLIRKSMVDEALYDLGVNNLSTSQIQKMDWKVLEKRVNNWISASEVAVKTLFTREKILCNEVFSASDEISKSCFAEITNDGAVSVLRFAGTVGKYNKLSVEKIFRFLDLYQGISKLLPEIDSIFDSSSVSAVRSQAVRSRLKLGVAIRAMLARFETAIQKDSSTTPPGGAVHPLTRYVMNYLVFLSDYTGDVSEIIADWPSSMQSPLPEAYFSIQRPGEDDAGPTAVSERFAWLILLLLCKLDGKTKMYRDVPLSYLFLANNLNYVVSKVRHSNLDTMLGSGWASMHEEKVKQYIANYERMGWEKVLSSLPDDPTSDISGAVLKNRFVKFNSGLEEALQKQSSWVIPDPELRDRVKVSLVNRIVPGYRVLFDGYRSKLQDGEVVVKFNPDSLQDCLSDMFDVNMGNVLHRTKLHTSIIHGHRQHRRVLTGH
ncbi:unnamed protein product [Cuscuta epithymum]|uniref:Exocyst subunit Exo70 family protein n=1 Tax=Cuscuta epithymum TaxID=186058 RepID=A0AAV0DT49_9ASTE|nr:unnamed protein product [Cuscuta epithymum]